MGLAQFLSRLGPIAVGSMALWLCDMATTIIHSLVQTPWWFTMTVLCAGDVGVNKTRKFPILA